jgi:RHS repeat-associated protein
LGSVREVVDATGTLRARYDYDAWGNRTKLSGDLEADFGFTGHLHHKQTGLILTHYRAYDPRLGRWLSRDPMESITREMPELEQGSNLYAYVQNDPVNYIDPEGLIGFGVEVGVSGTAGINVPGRSGVASAGMGTFIGPNPRGSLGSLGTFVSHGISEPFSDSAIGLGGGAGPGLFFTDADCAEDLSKTTDTHLLNLGLVSIAYSRGGGVNMLEVSGGRVGWSYGNLKTKTGGYTLGKDTGPSLR